MRRVLVQASQVEFSPPLKRRRILQRLAHGADNDHAVADQTAAGKLQCGHRVEVKPVGVVDHDNQGRGSLDVSQQGQCRQADEEAIRWSRSTDPNADSRAAR